jgi:predicted RNA binding protein YcfA (HicA-like mRNA interferase family)
MGRRHRPLTRDEVKQILRKLGFEPRDQKGSHEQWVKREENRFWKVTVDCPKAPFTQDHDYMDGPPGRRHREAVLRRTGQLTSLVRLFVSKGPS